MAGAAIQVTLTFVSVSKSCNKIGQVKIVIKCLKDHCVDVKSGKVMGMHTQQW